MRGAIQLTHKEGSSRRGGRLRRAQRVAAGVKAVWLSEARLDAGRYAFVTPPAMPTPWVGFGRLGVWKVVVSSALPPSENEGAGRKNGVGPATPTQREGDCRETASLRAKLPAAYVLTQAVQAPEERGQREAWFLYDGPKALAAPRADQA